MLLLSLSSASHSLRDDDDRFADVSASLNIQQCLANFIEPVPDVLAILDFSGSDKRRDGSVKLLREFLFQVPDNESLHRDRFSED